MARTKPRPEIVLPNVLDLRLIIRNNELLTYWTFIRGMIHVDYDSEILKQVIRKFHEIFVIPKRKLPLSLIKDDFLADSEISTEVRVKLEQEADKTIFKEILDFIPAYPTLSAKRVARRGRRVRNTEVLIMLIVFYGDFLKFCDNEVQTKIIGEYDRRVQLINEKNGPIKPKESEKV
jgi:hypothetical protein